MILELVVILLIGLYFGRLFGRWRAENRRARADMKRVWTSRHGYRKS